MSGIFSQFGLAEEVAPTLPTVTGGTGVSGVPNFAELTFDDDHGLRAGDRLTLTGFTPSGWNGTWTITSVPASDTVRFHTGTTLLADTTVEGTATATAWGVATTPNRFFEASTEGVVTNPGRIQGTGIRAGAFLDSIARSVTYPIDSTGPIELEVWDKGMELLWEHILGKRVTTGPTDSAYTHVFTPDTLRGKGFTYQKGVPDSFGTVWPFTIPGCKITKATLELAVDALLKLTVELDGQPAVLTVPLAVPSWVSGPHLMSYIGGSLTVDGNVWEGVISKVTLTIENNTKNDRRGLGSSTKREQLDHAIRTISVSADAEFTDLTMWEKFVAEVPEDSTADLSFSCQGPVLIGTSTYPSITFDVPNFRIDGSTPVVSGRELLMQNLTGPALDTTPGAKDALTVTVVSASSAP